MQTDEVKLLNCFKERLVLSVFRHLHGTSLWRRTGFCCIVGTGKQQLTLLQTVVRAGNLMLRVGCSVRSILFNFSLQQSVRGSNPLFLYRSSVCRSPLGSRQENWTTQLMSSPEVERPCRLFEAQNHSSCSHTVLLTLDSQQVTDESVSSGFSTAFSCLPFAH